MGAHQSEQLGGCAMSAHHPAANTSRGTGAALPEGPPMRTRKSPVATKSLRTSRRRKTSKTTLHHL